MNAWMKLVLLLTVATVLALIAATVLIGSKVREETVVSHPYEQGLEQTCDLAAGPCTRSLEGGGEVTLELGPRPLRTMMDLTVRAAVRVAGGSAPARAPAASVSFSMPDMFMGENRVALTPGADGLVGKAVLVRCPSGRRDWVAEVSVVQPGAAPRTARFTFRVAE